MTDAAAGSPNSLSNSPRISSIFDSGRRSQASLFPANIAANLLFCSNFLSNRAHLSSLTKPTLRPCGVNRSSALSIRKVQPELRPRREHPVRLVGPLGDQVIDQDPRIALGAAETTSGSKPSDLARRIESRHQPLAGGLLIPRGAIDLPRQEQTLESLFTSKA